MPTPTITILTRRTLVEGFTKLDQALSFALLYGCKPTEEIKQIDAINFSGGVNYTTYTNRTTGYWLEPFGMIHRTVRDEWGVLIPSGIHPSAM